MLWVWLLLAMAGEDVMPAPPPPGVAGAIVEAPAVLMQAPLNLADVLLGPIRDAHQLLPGPAHDADILPPPKAMDGLGGSLGTIDVGKQADPVWKYRVEAGGNFRQGNVSANNLNTLFAAERRTNVDMLQLKLGATYNRLSDTAANERYFGQMGYDRFLRGRWIAFAREEVENDSARRISIRSVASAGLGYRLIDNIDQRWVMRAGPSYTFLRQNPPNQPTLESSQAGFMIESEYRKALWETSRFEWTAALFPNFGTGQAFRVRNDVALLFPIGGHKSAWNWKVGGRHEYTQSPPAGTKPEDLELYFAISYAK